MAEVFDPATATNKLFITTKVGDLSPMPLPSTRWTVFFTRTDPAPATTSTEWFVAMVTDDTSSPGTPVYRYGHTSLGAGGVRQLTTDGIADFGTQNIDGTILIAISTPTPSASGLVFPALRTGEMLTNINAITQQSGGALLLTLDSTGNGAYTIAGNASCAPNAAPIAALAANPTTGVAPVTVNFNASASFDPDAADSVASYTFNFGDGSAPVTQAGATISHTYVDNGSYQATVAVTDNRGATSDLASRVIEVSTTLTGIVSRKTHGTAGDFDIDLNSVSGGMTSVECRNDGSNSHKIVFTFQRNLTTVSTSTVSEGTAVKGTEGVGPNANQYTVNLTNVNNAQYVTVRLDGVQDTAGANLTAVRGRVAILNGDVSANLATNATDVSQTKAVSGQPFQPANFRLDVNANGVINSSDVSQIKANSGLSISAGTSPAAGSASAKSR